VKDYTRVIVHLVKLVNAADTSVREDKGTTFKDQLMSFWVSCNINSETDSRTSLAWSIDASWCNFVNVLQKLRFGGWRITTKQDVDLSSEPAAAGLRKFFGNTSKELAQDAFLNVVALPDRWCQWVD